MRFSDGESARLSRDIVQKVIEIFREENRTVVRAK
jgi:hypothetical protein